MARPLRPNPPPSPPIDPNGRWNVGTLKKKGSKKRSSPPPPLKGPAIKRRIFFAASLREHVKKNCTLSEALLVKFLV